MNHLVVKTTAEIGGPPEVVWELITDWERQSEWMLEMSDIVVTTAHREGVGVKAEATVKIGGIRTRDPIRVDVWEPGRHLGIVHDGWVGGRGDLRLSPLPTGGTRLDWREELHPPWGPLGALGMRAFLPLLRRTFRRDIRVLDDLVRARARPGYPDETS